ncbi:alpha/beta hydrolase [bacterium]|nr:alpha/beta hydrolase [bacterium]
MRSRFLVLAATIFAFSSSMPLLAEPSAAKQTKLPPDRHEFDSDGVRIHYLDKGEGEPIILIHGFGANLDVNWAGIINRLSQDYRVIAIDNRGHGRSHKPHETEDYGIEMVNDVIRLMDHLKIKKAHIVGYSMGALISGKFLAEHPDRVISAVIGGMGWLQIDDQWKKLMDDVASSLDQGNGPIPLLEFLHPGEGETKQQEIERINTVFKFANDQKALAACIRSFPQFAIEKETLEKNERPTLCIIGDRDPFKPYADKTGEIMGNVKVVIIPGGDHNGTPRKAEFLQQLKTFLDSHRESPATAKPKANAA